MDKNVKRPMQTVLLKAEDGLVQAAREYVNAYTNLEDLGTIDVSTPEGQKLMEEALDRFEDAKEALVTVVDRLHKADDGHLKELPER